MTIYHIQTRCRKTRGEFQMKLKLEAEKTNQWAKLANSTNKLKFPCQNLFDSLSYNKRCSEEKQ